MGYLFFKWLHIVAVISWMAGILYLFRLFVYHVSHGLGNKDIHSLLTLMEKRLYRYITISAMLVAWVAGLSMIHFNPLLMKAGWLHGKLLLVVLLTGVTHAAGRIHKRLAAGDQGPYTVRSLKILNEVPTLLMMGIVALVVFKPL